MAIAIENETNNETTNSSSLTLPARTPAGTNRCVVCLSAGGANGGGPSVSSCVRGGDETFTEVMDQVRNTFTNHYISYYVAPDTDSGEIIMTFSKACEQAAKAFYLTGVQQSGSVDDSDNTQWGDAGSGTTTVSSQVNGLALGVVGCYNNPTPDAGQTQAYEYQLPGGGTPFYVNVCYESGAASVSLRWTWSSEQYQMGSVSFVPAAAASGATTMVPMSLRDPHPMAPLGGVH